MNEDSLFLLRILDHGLNLSLLVDEEIYQEGWIGLAFILFAFPLPINIQLKASEQLGIERFQELSEKDSSH